jgi:hypothetical protein
MDSKIVYLTRQGLIYDEIIHIKSWAESFRPITCHPSPLSLASYKADTAS